MAAGSARAFASAFRAIGLEAEPTPPSDNRTRELGARYTSGDECYPAKVTVGDFMKVVENPAIDKQRIALFMPTAQGPCRFGQYAPYLRQILDANGYGAVEILSPTSQNAYDGLGTLAGASSAPAGAPCSRPTSCRNCSCSRDPTSSAAATPSRPTKVPSPTCAAPWNKHPPNPACSCRRCAIAWFAAATASVNWMRAVTATCP